MKRDQLLRRIEHEWGSFLAAFEGLPDDMLLKPGTLGEWSIRDVIAHITTWEEEALKALPSVLAGKSTIRYVRYGGIDAFNAMALENRRHMSLSEVREALIATHKSLIDFLSTVPESAYVTESRFRRKLRLDTYHHYREHAGQIEAWRRDSRH